MSAGLVDLLQQALELAQDSPMTALLIQMALMNEERRLAPDEPTDP